MVKSVNLTFQEVSDVISYNSAAGIFTWKMTISSRAKAGQRAGVKQRMQNGKDYYSITYQGRKLSGGQVAWLLHYGEWPDRSIFFIDNDPTNLRISNLKLADHKAVKVLQDDGSIKYKMSEEQVRHYGLVRNYNISYTQYAKMFAAQNGVCAICNKPETARIPERKTDKVETKTRDLSVDHDHKTGAIRGLLCNACNHMLGEVNDNTNTLKNAILYLERYSSADNNVLG